MTGKGVTEKKQVKAGEKPKVIMEAEVARRIRQHGRSSMKAEVCGVLIGSEEGRTTIVHACITGVNAAQGGAHVTFTQDAWEHIYKVKDKQYPDDRIVGWYHSHPGFGVFLSDHDLFIQENFFSSPQQIAWVYDPHSDEEGCFGWCNKKIEKLDDVSFRFLEPKGTADIAHQIDEEDEVEAPKDEPARAKAGWLDIVITVATYCLIFVFGGTIGFFADVFLSGQANLIVPKSEIIKRQMVVVPGALVIAFDPDFQQCLFEVDNNARIRQQTHDPMATVPGVSEREITNCIDQLERRQLARLSQQIDVLSGIGASHAGIPLAPGGATGTQAPSVDPQPSQNKGGNHGRK